MEQSGQLVRPITSRSRGSNPALAIARQGFEKSLFIIHISFRIINFKKLKANYSLAMLGYLHCSHFTLKISIFSLRAKMLSQTQFSLPTSFYIHLNRF